MHTARMLLICLFTAGLLMLLAGCGGGGTSLSNSGTVSGTVLPLAGATASRDSVNILVGIEGTQLTTQPDADGRFLLNGVPPGVQTLYVMDGNGYLARSVVAIVEEGRETRVGDLQLVNAGWITGMVTSTATDQPVAGARVIVTNAVMDNTADVMPCPVHVTYTATDGTYAVRGLPEGSYAVMIEKHGFIPVSLVLYIIAGHTTIGDAALKPLPQHAGGMAGVVYTITDAGGLAPLAGAMVSLVPSGDPEPGPLPAATRPDDPASPVRVYYTFSDRNGQYQLDGMPAGGYLAIAQRPGFDPDRHNVTILGDATVQQDFQLHPHPVEMGAIIGTVTDQATGLPIASAQISAGIEPAPYAGAGGADSVVGPDGDMYRMCTVTDENGYYALKVPAGVTAIVARAYDYLPQQQPVSVIPGETVTVDFALEPATNESFTLSGQVGVQAADGTITPVPEAVVYAAPYATGPVIMSMPAIILSAQTDAEGYYTLPLPAWGTFTVYAVKDNQQSERTTLTLLGDVTQDFLLRPLE